MFGWSLRSQLMQSNDPASTEPCWTMTRLQEARQAWDDRKNKTKGETSGLAHPPRLCIFFCFFSVVPGVLCVLQSYHFEFYGCRVIAPRQLWSQPSISQQEKMPEFFTFGWIVPLKVSHDKKEKRNWSIQPCGHLPTLIRAISTITLQSWIHLKGLFHSQRCCLPMTLEVKANKNVFQRAMGSNLY